MRDQAKIHKMVYSQDISIRASAADALSSAFSHMANEGQAWDDLFALAKDEDENVQEIAALALVSVFPCLANKGQAWKDLLTLLKDEDVSVQESATIVLISTFPHLTNKEQAWEDLFALVKDEDISVQMDAVIILGSTFSYLANEEQAREDLLTLAKDEGNSVLMSVALSSEFIHMIDKEQATKDLLALLKDEDVSVRESAVIALGSVFHCLTDKGQAWKNLLALLEDGDRSVLVSVALILGSVFPHMANEESALDDLLVLLKDEDISVRLSVATTLGRLFPRLTDKEMATKNLLALVKDKNINVRGGAALVLGSAFSNLTDKEQVWENLLAQLKDEDYSVRVSAAHAFSYVAKHYIDEKNFKKASQCFSEASSVFKYGLLGHIKPKPKFYLYEGFSCYYQGRALVSELPENEPEVYVKNIKKSVRFLKKSIKNINKSGFHEYEDETRFFPICLNIYSALYEYNLSYLNFDKKRFVKIKDYLDNASAQCKIAGTQQGEDLVRIVEKLTSSLKIFLEKVEQENKKYEAAKNGKGGGWDAKYERHIDKLKNDFKESLVEIDNALNEIEAPLFKKIVAIEKESLEMLQSSEPKTSWQRLRKFIHDFIKRFWKIIAGILTLVVGIIKIWQFIAG